MRARRFAVPLACTVALALSACGFHPRGEMTLPAGMGAVKAFSVDPYDPLVAVLNRDLARTGAQAGADPAAKGPTVVVAGQTWEQLPLTVNVHAQATEYNISYVVKYELLGADGKAIVPMQEARLQRDFQYDAAHALGSAQEQDTIRDEMRRDMAATIIRRIDIVLRNYRP
ncbi:MAG: hypothetical protein JSS03_07035 [Proteobacteria bacterium]|nr:hypothetical protein [Pseudomonadota bacterium]